MILSTHFSKGNPVILQCDDCGAVRTVKFRESHHTTQRCRRCSYLATVRNRTWKEDLARAYNPAWDYITAITHLYEQYGNIHTVANALGTISHVTVSIDLKKLRNFSPS